MLVYRTQPNNCTTPAIWTIYQDNKGILTNVYALGYEVFDVSTPAKQVAPVEVVALTDLPMEACPAGAILSTGRFVAPFTIGANWALGNYVVRWHIQPTEASSTYTVDQGFTVTDQAHGKNVGYVSVQDMIDSGASLDVYTIAQIQGAIRMASMQIEKLTRRYFYPVYKGVRRNGRGGPKLLLTEPIIAIESVSASYEDELDFLIDGYFDTYRVFNRHIREGLMFPDDRNNPKLEFSYASRPAGMIGRWPDGTQDVLVTGVFGYTDPDGSPLGVTPEAIKQATILLAWKYVAPAGSAEAEVIKTKSKITEERTRDQSVKYGGVIAQSSGNGYAPGSASYLTGDPEIDTLLLPYVAGPWFTGA